MSGFWYNQRGFRKVVLQQVKYFHTSVTRIWSSSVQLQAEMNLGFLRASSYLDYVKFQLLFLGFWWTRGLSFTETYMDQQVHVTATSSMAACCMGESACVFVSLPLPP
jgi:hypothetical protein